jgi:23S rRNA (uracil1939-C5)-methyltransferase
VRKNKVPIVLKNVTVTDYAAEGKCIARVEGKVIFIEKVVPGDVVDIKLTKNKKDWAEAFPLHFVAYSKDRNEAFCQHFGVCGGCIWQMLPYHKQLQYKHQQVVDNLERIAKVPLPAINSIVGATETQYYRNKLEYTFSTKKYLTNEEVAAMKSSSTYVDDVSAAGFHARGFFDKVVEIETCHLQQEPTNGIRNAVANFAKQHNISFYDIRNHKGFLRNMMVRITTTGEVMVNLVVGEEDKEKIDKIVGFIKNTFPSITTLLYTINTKFNDSIYDLNPIVVTGNGYITEQLKSYKFIISPKSFFQTNTKQAEQLYSITKDFAELDGSQIVYDLYGGTGSIGIFVSDQAKKIVGVELVKEAVEDAHKNATLNNLKHASFFVGDVIDVCNDYFFAQHGKPDVIITDPPRAGMHQKLVQKILDMEAPIVVYVSCNPATQARDLALLDEKYMITKVQPVDMFPHTHHIENVVQLKLKK